MFLLDLGSLSSVELEFCCNIQDFRQTVWAFQDNVVQNGQRSFFSGRTCLIGANIIVEVNEKYTIKSCTQSHLLLSCYPMGSTIFTYKKLKPKPISTSYSMSSRPRSQSISQRNVESCGKRTLCAQCIGHGKISAEQNYLEPSYCLVWFT